MIDGIQPSFFNSDDTLILEDIPVNLSNFKSSFSFWFRPQKQNSTTVFKLSPKLNYNLVLFYGAQILSELNIADTNPYTLAGYLAGNYNESDYILFDLGNEERYVFLSFY